MKVQKLIPLLVIVAGLLAYQNSFTGPFIFDDTFSIKENPTIRILWPIWQPLSPPHRGGLAVEGRPIINLSLAINYALGGCNVWGYHALNLTIHILAGLTLYGMVRRTLLQPRLRERFGAAANGLALATAVLWTVHPLQTESVTYMVQRAESLMGLFYLLTLYCFIRGVESQRPRLWYGLSAFACALGMGSKEVMVSAPVMVLLYDRTFASGSFREAWRQRRPLYLALASTWILLGVVLASGQIPATTKNAQRIGLAWWQYLATEPGVIVHYLRLSVWPHPLCFDYKGWPLAKTWMSILPPALVLAILLGVSVWACKANSAWGLLGAGFFLVLAPSSSFIPLDTPAFEHRMYLPLAALVVTGVIGIHALVRERTVAVVVMLGIGLGVLTWQRNQDYRSELGIWEDTVAKRPDNPRAQSSLADALFREGRVQEAIASYERALQLKPDYAETHNNLGIALARAGSVEEAIGHFEEALRFKPDYPEAANNLGNALAQVGKVQEAMGHYDQVLRFKPDDAETHYNLGVALQQAGRVREAIEHYEQAVRLKPDSAEMHSDLGGALLRLGRVQEAVEHYEQAVRLKPDYAQAHNGLALALVQLGRLQEAIGHWEQTLRLQPNIAEAHYNLGVALGQVGRVRDAIGHYERALRLKSDYTKAQGNLAWLLATLAPAEGGDPVRAVTLAQRVCEQTDNRMAAYLDTLAVAYAAAGRFGDAITTAQRAIDLAGSAGQSQLVLEIETRLKLYREGHAYRQSIGGASPHGS